MSSELEDILEDSRFICPFIPKVLGHDALAVDRQLAKLVYLIDNLNSYIYLKPAAGFELATFRLQVGCTTTVLCWQVRQSLLNSNHNLLLYHNQFICLGAIAKIISL